MKRVPGTCSFAVCSKLKKDLILIFLFAVGCCAPAAFAQVNSWTKSSSGNWEEPAWSLGALPGTNQSVFITNANWKAVQITAATAASYPQSLSVNSITLASPTNTFNSLFLNYVGTGNPLRANGLVVSSNTAVTLLASALQIGDPGPSAFSVGGTLNQGEYSVVNATQFDLGYIGPGVYNLTNGFLTTQVEYLGGSFSSLFNQENGIHSTTILQVNTNAEFRLSGGWFMGDIDLRGGTINQLNGTNSSPSLDLSDGAQYFLTGGMVTGVVNVGTSGGAVFTQNGGLLDAPVQLVLSSYVLNGGLHTGNIYGGTISFGSYSNYNRGPGSVLQTGGTNLGDVSFGMASDEIGRSYWGASYTISNGVFTGGISLDGLCSFTQSGGSNRVVGPLVTRGNFAYFGYEYFSGVYVLNGGILNLDGWLMEGGGEIQQSGGTNICAGGFTLQPSYAGLYLLSGGLLCDSDVTVESPYNAGNGFIQTGGTHICTNKLSLSEAIYTYLWNYDLSGGTLITSNIVVNGGRFRQTGGVVTQSGTFTLDGGTFFAGASSQSFGPLQLSNTVGTNSTLTISSNTILRFANSSALSWDAGETLTIQNWSGTDAGGGSQQIFFGNNSSGLSAQQLSDIKFNNPGGFAPGIYAAQILSTGEIVPAAGANSSGALPPTLNLLFQTNGVQIQLQGPAGRSYEIEVSTNLTDWVPWTNRFNTNGTVSIQDDAATNYPRRFYRALVQP